MKKFALLVVSLFAAGSALYARKPAPVIPDFIHAAYSVESLLSEAELTNPGYDAFQFIYLMATPEWAGLDFDRPQDAVDAYATQFDYLKQGGKMALAPSMIEKAHAAGARILLCFGGQQEFLPLLENPDRIPRFVGYMVRLVEKNGYDGIDMDWEITLDKELTIDEVTEIFIRINSQGAKLNQADFAMSKIAANTHYGGNMLRKAIDYFSHLAVQPDWYAGMVKDTEFMASPFAARLRWLKDDREEIFDPDYNDILRIAFMYKFGRAKMKDLVSLLGGRDFESRDYKEEIAAESFKLLTGGVMDMMNEYSFCNFVQTIKSAGFIDSKLINSRVTLDFAYTLYLLLQTDPKIDKNQIKRYVAKWYVMATITSRYISSPETMMDMDIRRIEERGFVNYFQEVEEANLSETFWTIGLVQSLETSAVNSPFFNTFLAAQIRNGESALFSDGSKIADLISIIGDVHHIFPKKYLIRNGYTEKSKYNQIANYTYLDTQVNKAISDDAPNVYFNRAFARCETGTAAYGNITNRASLEENLTRNCIPTEIVRSPNPDYDEFLNERRKRMAQKIRTYYYSL